MKRQIGRIRKVVIPSRVQVEGAQIRKYGRIVAPRKHPVPTAVQRDR
jgi:hypothetical protein